MAADLQRINIPPIQDQQSCLLRAQYLPLILPAHTSGGFKGNSEHRRRYTERETSENISEGKFHLFCHVLGKDMPSLRTLSPFHFVAPRWMARGGCGAQNRLLWSPLCPPDLRPGFEDHPQNHVKAADGKQHLSFTAESCDRESWWMTPLVQI